MRRRIRRAAAQRTVILAVPVVLGAGLALAGCGGDDSPGAAPASAPAQVVSNSAAPSPAVQEKALGTFTVTCHTGSGQTASGAKSGPGVAAVDTDVFPLGTKLRVEKVGVVTAADKGSAVDGKSLDIWLPSSQACTDFGRQQLQVWRQTG